MTRTWLHRTLVLLLLAGIALTGCQRRPVYIANDFVGLWKSSRSIEPIELFPNGEWEIRDEEGNLKHFGAWRYEDYKLVWSFPAQRNKILDDPNPVLEVTRDRFMLKELDGTTSTFTRLR